MIQQLWGFPRWHSGKESACNAGDTGDVGSVPGQEDPLAEGMAPHSSILAWRIPWTEEPGRLQSEGFEESDTTKQLSTRTRTHTHIQQGNYTMISWVYPRNERLS